MAFAPPTASSTTSITSTFLNLFKDACNWLFGAAVMTLKATGAVLNPVQNCADFVIDINIDPAVTDGTGYFGCTYHISAGGPDQGWMDVQIGIPSAYFTHDALDWPKPKVLGLTIGGGVAEYDWLMIGRRNTESDTGFTQRFMFSSPPGYAAFPSAAGKPFNLQGLVRGLRKTTPV